MKRSTIGIIIAVIAVVGIIALVMPKDKNNQQPQTTTPAAQEPAHNDSDTHLQGEATTQPKQSSTNEVEIADFSFRPGKITVKKGTTVKWTNKDTAKHDITPDSPSENFKASELLAKGESYSFTFNTTGTYTYNCSPHPYMKGSVEVTE